MKKCDKLSIIGRTFSFIGNLFLVIIAILPFIGHLLYPDNVNINSTLIAYLLACLLEPFLIEICLSMIISSFNKEMLSAKKEIFFWNRIVITSINLIILNLLIRDSYKLI